MFDEIKVIIQAMMQHAGISILEAVVTKLPPDINIKLVNDEKMIIKSPEIITSERLTEHKKEIILSGNSQIVTYKNELKIGDKVLVMEFNGGQQYYIMDKVVR